MAACRAMKSSNMDETDDRCGDAYFLDRTCDGWWRWRERLTTVKDQRLVAQSLSLGSARFKMHRANAKDDRAMTDGRVDTNSLWKRAISAIYQAICSTCAS